MEKTIEIDNRPVTFKTTGSLPVRYMAQFSRDIMADLIAIMPMMDVLSNLKDKDMATLTKKDLAKIDFGLFYNIFWVMAKIADKKTPSPVEWLDTFESFPMLEIIPQLEDLISAAFGTSKKNKMDPPVKPK